MVDDRSAQFGDASNAPRDARPVEPSPASDKEPAGKHPLSFTLRGVPELEQFPTEAGRQAALAEIAHEAANLRSGSYWLAVGILVASVLIARWIVKWGLGRVVWNFWLEECILWAAIIGVFWMVLRMLHRWGAPEELRTKLLRAGVPVCLTCGYSLRGLPLSPGRCPECGREFDARVQEILSKNPEAPK